MEPCPYSPTQVKEIQAKLSERRTYINRSISMIAGDLRYENPGHFADEIDNVSHNFEQGFDVRIREREQKLLSKIDKALARIDHGSYGVCLDCGDWIQYERLLARPVAELCIECKEDQELQEKLEMR